MAVAVLFFLKLNLASDFCGGNSSVVLVGCTVGVFTVPDFSAIFAFVDIPVVPDLSTSCMGIICTRGLVWRSLCAGIFGVGAEAVRGVEALVLLAERGPSLVVVFLEGAGTWMRSFGAAGLVVDEVEGLCEGSAVGGAMGEEAPEKRESWSWSEWWESSSSIVVGLAGAGAGVEAGSAEDFLELEEVKGVVDFAFALPCIPLD